MKYKDTPNAIWTWGSKIFTTEKEAMAARDFTLSCNKNNESGLKFYSALSIHHFIKSTASLESFRHDDKRPVASTRETDGLEAVTYTAQTDEVKK